MKRGWLVVGLLLSLGVNLGLIGTAVSRRRMLERWWSTGGGIERPFERPGDRHAGRPFDRPGASPGERLADRLGLDAERRERFVAAQRRMIEQTVLARREIGEVRDELRRELVEREPDRERIGQLLRRLGAAEAAVNRAFVDGVLEAKAELDPRQAREFLRLMAELGATRPGAGPRGLGAGNGPTRFRRGPEGGRGPSPPEPEPREPPPAH